MPSTAPKATEKKTNPKEGISLNLHVTFIINQHRNYI